MDCEDEMGLMMQDNSMERAFDPSQIARQQHDSM